MFIYTIQAMPGQKAKFEGDTSIKYRVKRVNDSIPVSKKGRSEIIRDNLEYAEAMELINGFNSMEGKSQVIRNDVAGRKTSCRSCPPVRVLTAAAGTACLCGIGRYKCRNRKTPQFGAEFFPGSD